MASVRRRHLSAIAGLVLIAQAGSFIGHFVAVEHTVSSATGELAHASECHTEHVLSEQPEFTPACPDEHAEHACEVWTLLQTTLLGSTDSGLALNDSVDADSKALDRLVVRAVVRFAPKQSPPV